MPRHIHPARALDRAVRYVGGGAVVAGLAGALAGIAGMPLYCVAFGAGSVLLFEIEQAIRIRADRRDDERRTVVDPEPETSPDNP